MKKVDFPIVSMKREILDAIHANPYTIVTAETGSGKSTLIGLWLLEEFGWSSVITEPLIETVIGTSEFTAEIFEQPWGSLVGYRTGEGRKVSKDTKITFCTDGLALARELLFGHNKCEVLILDELHEWNKNQSTLEAWAWKQIVDGKAPFKVLVLSADIDAEALSKDRGNAPVISVPGRGFEIEDRPAGESIPDDIETYVKMGCDILCFESGKTEIEKVLSELKQRGLDAELLPFHSQLTREAKNRAYKMYARPKVVVATNSLETGRTLLPSMQKNSYRSLAVVDSGMEKRIEVVDGVEGLYLRPIALAKRTQRRGRTGRVSKGFYTDHCPVPESERPKYPVPEILRTRLDMTVLRLAVFGFDATDLPFFHQPDHEVLVDAKRVMQALGAMDEEGNVTKTGRFMAKLPADVKINRMVVEADKRDVMDDIFTIGAIYEAGGIRAKGGEWRNYTKEENSDLLAELDLWNAANGKSGDELRKMGIMVRNYFKAKDIRRKLADAVRGLVQFGSTGNREDIKKCIAAGFVDHLYQFYSGSRYGAIYQNGNSGQRNIDRQSVISGSPEWVVGEPFDLELNGRRGKFTINLIVNNTAVDPTWLAEVAPQLVKIEEGLKPYYDDDSDTCKSTTRTHFNGQQVKEEEVATPEHEEAADMFAGWLASRMSI